MQQSFDLARKNMIDGQLRPNKVVDAALLAAIASVPRERFLPRHLQSIAYVDEDVAIGNGRYLQEPMVLARLMQAAEISSGDVVLDIGCGTGYSCAVLGQMAGTVVAVESDKAMAMEADRTLRELDICNVAVIQQKNLREGYKTQGPYNAIFINGSIPEVPMEICQQLVDGGRLVTVLSDGGHMGEAVVILRTGDIFSTRPLFDAATPVLAGFVPEKSFVF